MDQNRTAIERAFELAVKPGFTSISSIRQALSAEGYSTAQLEGPSLRRQLRALIDGAKLAGQQERTQAAE